jgi:uncharacterized repeat protein (TIGR03803 family)
VTLSNSLHPLRASSCRNFRTQAGRIAPIIMALLVTIAPLTGRMQAQTFTTLYSFKYGTDGGIVSAGLIEDAAGNLYGAAEVGGNLSCTYSSTGFAGCGVIFKVTQTGHETVLYAFNGNTDGAGPKATLIRDAQGDFYGTTAFGGDPECTWGNGAGCGTVFKLDTAGKETVLYRFHGGSDGASPGGALFLDKAGSLWGTTQFGGLTPASCEPSGCGTLFRLDAAGKLYSYDFKGAPNDGSWPLGGLVGDSQGNILGTTQFGGPAGGGTVFQITPAGGEKLLGQFGSTLFNPTGLLLSEGSLYGPAVSGGQLQGGGVFVLNPEREVTIYNFFPLNDSATVGAEGVLARDDSHATLFGTTAFDGGFGSVYAVQDDGNYTTLYYFSGTDGQNPVAGVIRDSAGNLYGTTQAGSTVFKLTP